MITSYESVLYIDPRNGEVDADINMKYVVKADGEKSIELYLYKDFKVSKISSLYRFDLDISVKSHSQIIANTQVLKLDFDKEFKKGDTIDVFLRYKGKYEDPNMHLNSISENIIEMGIYSPWFPITEGITEYNFKTDIMIDDDYIIVGSPSISKIKGGWRIEQSKPFYDCSFVGLKNNNEYYSASHDGVEVRFYYINQKNNEICNDLSKKVASMLELYTTKFGAVEKSDLNVVVVDRDNSNSGGGYNRPGLVVLPDLLDRDSSNSDKYGEGELYAFEYLAHEIAHLWWNKAPLLNYEDWLNESFAEYSSILAVESIISKEAFHSKILKYREASEVLPPIIGIDRSDDRAFDTLYMKGPIILNTLRETVGDKLFFDIVKDTHQNCIVKTDDFIEHINTICGSEVSDKILKLLSN